MVLFLLLSLIGCIPLKKTLYVQNGKAHQPYTKETLTTSTYTYTIAKKDILQVDMGSVSPEKLNDIVQKQQTLMSGTVGQDVSLQGYIVDDKGQILLPFIGYVSVEGLTLTEAQEMIYKKLSEYVSDSHVKVRLLSFNITVLGEVGKPGRMTINTPQINILEAIALAGDLPITANHQNVRVIRIVNGQVTTHYVDLTSEAVYQSEVFYLQPGDMLYVEPVKAKVTQNNLTAVTIATTILNTLFLITNIIVVLSR